MQTDELLNTLQSRAPRVEAAWCLAAVVTSMASAWIAGTLWPNAHLLAKEYPVLDSCRLSFAFVGFMVGLRSQRFLVLAFGPLLGFGVGYLHYHFEMLCRGRIDGAWLLVVFLFWGSVIGCIWERFQKPLRRPLQIGGALVIAELLGHWACVWLKRGDVLAHFPGADPSWFAIGARHVFTSVVVLWIAARLGRPEKDFSPELPETPLPVSPPSP